MKKVANYTIYQDAPANNGVNQSSIRESHPAPYNPLHTSTEWGGLSDLQRSTHRLLKEAAQKGFAGSGLKVQRHKLNNQTWQLTVINPRTRKTILQAEGDGDTVLAHEENLARMAEALMAQGLTVRTHFDE